MNPSVVLHVSFIDFFIRFNRKRKLHSIAVSQILTFLSENIDGAQLVENFHSTESFFQKLSHQLVDKEVLKWFEVCVNDYFATLDSFFNFNFSLQDLFEFDKNESINELSGPIKICSYSFIGVFVRSYIVQWECLSFEIGCTFYEELRYFYLSTRLSSSSAEESIGYYNSNVDLKSFFSLAASSMSLGDLAATEEAIHLHFDLAGVSEGQDVQSLNQSDKSGSDGGNEVTVISALSNLVRSIGNTADSTPNFGSAFNSKVTVVQQRAMLSLVTMWTASLTTNGGSSEVALSAVEEAMRTAHKRGDHDAVARTLLLMFHVLQQKQLQSGEKDFGLEDLLLRCVNRFAALKSHHMVAEAALSLVALRAKGSIAWSDHSRGGVDEQSGSLGGARWSVADLWTQIGVSLLGNSTIVARVVNLLSGILGSDDKANVAVSTSSTAQQMNRAANKEMNLDAYLSETDVVVQARLHLMATLITCNILRRMGQLQMADLACRRTLRQHSAHATPDDLSRLYAELICVKVDAINLRLINFDLSGPCDNSLFLYSSAEGSCPYESVLCWARDVQKAIKSDGDQMEIAVLYARIFQSAGRRRWDQALRLTERALLLSNRSSVSVEGAGDASVREFVSEDHLRLRVLLAKILCVSNFPAAHQILVEVVALAQERQLLQLQCVSEAVMHAHSLKYSDHAGRVYATMKLKIALTFAHRVNVSEPEIVLVGGLVDV